MGIKVEHLNKSFVLQGEQNKVVDDVSFVVPNGKMVCLLGPSGSGKTTILNLISGLSVPDSGSVYFDNKDMTNVPANKRNIGFVFQNFALYDHLSVKNNIAFPLSNIVYVHPLKKYKDNIKALKKKIKETLKNHGDVTSDEQALKLAETMLENTKKDLLKMKKENRDSYRKIVQKRMNKKEKEEIVSRLADMLDIKHLLKRRVRQLSGGEQQRVAIARALAKNPDYLLLDEPLSNLDTSLRNQTLSQIRKIQNDLGITTIFVSHDIQEAFSNADQVIIINQGKIAQIGTPNDIYEKPANLFVATFIDPSINIIKAMIKDGQLWIQDALIAVDNRYQGKNRNVYLTAQQNFFNINKTNNNDEITINIFIKDIKKEAYQYCVHGSIKEDEKQTVDIIVSMQEGSNLKIGESYCFYMKHYHLFEEGGEIII